ncbi:M48 family metallopeptidase [Oricola cellulosilytica]|uniref:M48 family peptidase n=1 Tax=Oricola cellulosilytica TaxID=1429082 RepID=A0A4R0PGS5_9HYPH|nr:M48 family metallopeptidase [Oricola cellulosilytica]TCD16034.1 M48 family peptidase [Oricola cellulosilytica]
MAFRFARNLMADPPAPAVQRLTHDVAGRTLPLRIAENPRARRLTLRIKPGAKGLSVTTPVGISMLEVERFLHRNRGWLEEKLRDVPEKPVVRPGIRIPVRGVNHEIVHEPGRGVTRTVRGEAGAQLIVRGDRIHLPRRIADFLKKEARSDIGALVEKHSAAVGRKAKSIRFKDTVSRWGSCSSEGNLSFSWRIMMAPRPVIDYLVAHEVAHLVHMNHSKEFWALCEELCPDTKRCKAWLKKNGGALQAIAFS